MGMLTSGEGGGSRGNLRWGPHKGRGGVLQTRQTWAQSLAPLDLAQTPRIVGSLEGTETPHRTPWAMGLGHKEHYHLWVQVAHDGTQFSFKDFMHFF